jgi:hypothetical protein
MRDAKDPDALIKAEDALSERQAGTRHSRCRRYGRSDDVIR